MLILVRKRHEKPEMKGAEKGMGQWASRWRDVPLRTDDDKENTQTHIRMKRTLALMAISLVSQLAIAQQKYNSYGYTEENRNGMTFGVWYVRDNTTQTGYAIAPVNMTREILQTRLLKLQVEEMERKAEEEKKRLQLSQPKAKPKSRKP